MGAVASGKEKTKTRPNNCLRVSMITATFVVKELNVWGKRSNVNVVM